jgi:hypothetical protein
LFISKCEPGERRLEVIELGESANLYRKPVKLFLRET